MRDDQWWRTQFRDELAWSIATAELDNAQEALDWLTKSIVAINNQLADAKLENAGRRLDRDEWRDFVEWRRAATYFQGIANTRKRELARQIKRQNFERTEQSAANQLIRLRSRLWRAAEDGKSLSPDEIRDLLAAVEVTA